MKYTIEIVVPGKVSSQNVKHSLFLRLIRKYAICYFKGDTLKIKVKEHTIKEMEEVEKVREFMFKSKDTRTLEVEQLESFRKYFPLAW